MGEGDSALDAGEIARARALLRTPPRRDRAWPAVAAAGLLAISAIGFAAAMVLAPPLKVEHPATGAPS